jgi:hypothetical protein
MENKIMIYKNFRRTFLQAFSLTIFAALLFAGSPVNANASIFTQSQKLTASDGAGNHQFGTSVAVSGDTMVVGAYAANGNKGAAYVFVRSGNSWIEQARLVANDGAAHYYFGSSVAISGDTIIVGSPQFGTQGGGTTNGEGAAYVFVRTGGVWTPQEKFYLGNQQGYQLGTSVSISGDTAVVGAKLETVNSTSFQGTAYVFVRNGGAWTQQQRLTANTATQDGYFGKCVSIAGSTLIVGANNDSSSPTGGRGFAYVFTRSGTTWTQQARLSASDGANNDSFGSSIDFANSLTGTVAVIGAHSKNVAGNNSQGAAYIFTRSGTIWTQQQKLVASDGAAGDSFGISVSIAPILGNTVIISASGDDINSNSSQGSAYIFKRDGSVWTQQQRLTAFDGAASDRFGSSVAITGDTAVASAPLQKVGANSFQGSAYVFNLGSRPFDFDGDSKSDISIFRPSSGEWWIQKSSDGGNFAAQFGASTDKIMPADFTGDGKTDVALFRPSTGAWYVLRSEDSSFYSFPFGANGDVPVVGDYDADGKADAAVFRPSTTTWYISKSTGGTTIQQFGQNGDIPTIGDYDGDGKADIAIYRVSSGQWWIQRSSNNSVLAFQFGSSTDKPVQGDYTGDSKTDVAIWRPVSGEWFILRSEDSSFYSFPFGASGDIPSPADYDGDGRFDATIFRPSTTTWYSQRTTAGTLIQLFGQNGDIPIPNAFVH